MLSLLINFLLLRVCLLWNFHFVFFGTSAVHIESQQILRREIAPQVIRLSVFEAGRKIISHFYGVNLNLAGFM